MKKILIISTSPRVNSNSEALAKAFARGAQEAGHEAELISLRGKTVNFCRGCFVCQEKLRCVIRDDADVICRKALEEVREQCGTLPPLFACYHIPSDEFLHAAADAGYQGDSDYWAKYELGVTLPARNGDFGKRDDPQGRVGDNDAFLEFFKAAGGDGIFVGHYHKNCTSILSDGVRYTFGLKTGVYDYHNSDMIGGTLITLTGENGGAPGENGGAHGENGGAPGENGGAHGETADRPGFSVKHLYTRLKDDFWERLERAGE